MYNYVYVLVCAYMCVCRYMRIYVCMCVCMCVYMCVCVCGLQSRDGMVEGWVVHGFAWYCMEWNSMGWYEQGWVAFNEKQSKAKPGCDGTSKEFNGMVQARMVH